MMILYPNWVEFRVDGKTLMMDNEGDLVSLVGPYSLLQLLLIVMMLFLSMSCNTIDRICMMLN